MTPEALARKWCPNHAPKSRLSGTCECEVIAAAVREALEPYQHLVNTAKEFEEAWIDKVGRGLLVVKVIRLGDAIAALREGRDA